VVDSSLIEERYCDNEEQLVVQTNLKFKSIFYLWRRKIYANLKLEHEEIRSQEFPKYTLDKFSDLMGIRTTNLHRVNHFITGIRITGYCVILSSTG
jgi:hypothetical protein